MFLKNKSSQSKVLFGLATLYQFSEKLEALLNEKSVNAEAAAKLILSINFLIKHPFDFFGECENFHRTEIWGSNEGEIQYWYVTFYVNCDKIIFTIVPSQEGPEKWRNDIS